MMRLIFFCLSLFGASPAFSFVIPDDTTTQRVFHAASNDPTVFQPLADAFNPLVKNVEDKLNSLLQISPDGSNTRCFWDQSERGGNLEVLDTAGWLKSISEAQDEPSESISKHHHHHRHDHHKDHEHPDPPSDPHEPHRDSSLLDLISSSKHSSAFYETIKDNKDITDLLKDKGKNTTVFIPSNAAFECLDKYRKHHDLPKDLLHRILQYHFAPGMHDWDDLRFHNTLLTKLPEDDLGKGQHQRLRIGPGARINLYAHFKMVDIYAGNGVIHAINAILLPPPDIADIVKILPTMFSTSEAALSRTGLTDELPKLTGQGGTVFLPTNKHWKELGFLINAFLFSDHGTPYLRALMKYHIAPGYSLYSDALVHKEDSKSLDERDDPDGLTHGYSHSWIPTLLKDKHISADINRFARFLSFRANGINSIIFSDGIARNGVIQVPDHILIPPHTLADHRDPPKMAGAEEESNGWLSVGELKEILEPMVERDNSEYEL